MTMNLSGNKKSTKKGTGTRGKGKVSQQKIKPLNFKAE